MQVRLLGTVELIDDEGRPVPLGGPKQRALFTMLAMRPNEVVPESRLLEALWGEHPPRTAGKTLQSHISRLRRALADAVGFGPRIDSRPSGYVLQVTAGDLDVTHAETTIAEARRLASEGDHVGAAGALAGAQAAWRGRPLGEFADEPWAMVEAARLSELRVAVIEERMDEELACGRHAAVVSDLEALTSAYPLRERLWGHRMLALYRTGRQADALRVYQDLRRHLGEELGIEPGPALAQLEARILRQDPTLAAPVMANPPSPPAAPAVPTESTGAPSIGVVTFLLTDIEGSSSMWERDAAGMATTLERHDRLIANAVQDGRGTTVKGKREGDGTCNVFRRASDAAATALVIVRALSSERWAPGLEPRVRVALHTGEILEGDRDYEGPTFNRAARLRSLATGGQIVLSQATAELVRDQLTKDADLIELGWYPVAHQPRGELLFELRPAEAQDRAGSSDEPDAPVPVPLPASLTVYDDGSFVGRREELDRLRQLWDDGRGSGCSLVFLGGEPGIGKTRLAVELARALHGEGVTVLFGRCDEEMLVPYQPFVEALRDYIACCPARTLRNQLHGLGGELARLVPQLGQRLPGLPPPVRGDPETERYRLFEAVSDLVISMSRAQPVLLVLDDLQWADKPTLLLLRHLRRSASQGTLLLLGTYRDVELTRSNPLAEALADLRREQLVERLALGGLSEPEVESLLHRLAGDAVPAGLAAALHRETEGNPLFVSEVLRHLAETGALSRQPDGASLTIDRIGIPEGVREVVGRRLQRLSADANQVLALAAVVGREFGLEVLELVSDLPSDQVLVAVEEATAARLIGEVPGAGTKYAFSHVLVRETLYGELATARRVRLHRRVGEALERLDPDSSGHLAELARHFYEAAQAGEVEKAVDYSRRAGDAAMGLLAYEEAAEHYDRAIQALDLDRHPDDFRRIELLMVLGNACWRGGERPRARQAFLEAVGIARRLGSPELMAPAVLAVGELSGAIGELEMSGTTDEAIVELLEESIAALPGEDSPLRARLMGRLATALYWTERRENREALSRSAVEMAQRSGDSRALLATMISRRYALLGPDDDLEARLAGATEILRLALDGGDAEQALEARQFRILDLLELGDIASADAEIELYRMASAELRHPFYLWYSDAIPALRALLDGRFAEAEEQATKALTWSDRAPGMAALLIYGAQMLWAWSEQGRFDVLESILSGIIEMAGAIPAVRAALAWVYADLGRLDEARERFDELAGNGFVDFPRDVTWLAGAALLSQTCVNVGDRDGAAVLYTMLQPFAGRLAMVWTAFSFGPVDQYLGILALLLGDHQQAIERLEAAERLSRQIGSPPFVAHAQVERARAHLERGDDGDAERAAELLAAARPIADKLGMAPLVRRADALLASL